MKRFLSVACPGLTLRAEGRELRSMADADTVIDLTAATELAGYAAKFDVRSLPLGGFIETIAPGAFDDCLDQDTCALFNHDASQVLGRASAGSLRIAIDATGLRYDCDLAGDDVSQRVAAYVADGRVSQSSFQFTVAMDGDQWDLQDDGVVLRTINRVAKLYDVSPVTYPAYPDAEVQLRSAFAEAQRAGIDLARAAARRAAAHRDRELELLKLR